VNEGYSTVANLAARRCDGREGVALLGPEQLVSPLCSGCRWRLLGLRASPCGERAGSQLGSSLAPATEREVKLLWSKGQRKMRAELGGGRSGEGVLVLGDDSGDGGSAMAFFFFKAEGRRLAFVGWERRGAMGRCQKSRGKRGS
jgi:hypothetical protein